MRKCLMLFIGIALMIQMPSPLNVKASTNELAIVESIVEHYFTDEKLEEQKIVSAAVSVVSNGNVLYSEAFGSQNLTSNIRATPDKTMFRIGSISKTFVGTAVLQLVEQGKLDLHADVNEYLTHFQIPRTYEEPITLHHLLTHTSGFEEVFLNTVELHYDKRLPLSQYVKEALPHRIRKPGQVIAYNNYGPTLAAYIVEAVSGVPYEQYVMDNIFQPLEMDYTDVEVGSKWLDELAYEYIYKQGQFNEIKLYTENIYPSGDIIASVDNMSNYMMAHLKEMRHEANILFHQPEKPLYATQFSMHPKIPGYTYTFHERFFKGYRLLEHGGTMAATNSYMVLSPDHNLGIFVVIVGNQSPKLVADQLLDAFIAPKPNQDQLEPTIPLSSNKDYSGTYAPNIYPENDFTKFSLMTSEVLTIEEVTNGVRLYGYGMDTMYDPVSEQTFRSEEGAYIVFGNDDGNDYVVYEGVVFEKMPWYHVTLNSHPILILFITLFFLVTTVTFTIMSIVNAFKKKPIHHVQLIVGLSAVCYLWMIGCFVYYIATVDTMFYLNAEVPVLLKLAMLTPIIGLILTVLAIFLVIRKWSETSKMLRFYTICHGIVSAIFSFIAYYYHLMGVYY